MTASCACTDQFMPIGTPRMAFGAIVPKDIGFFIYYIANHIL